MSQLGFSEGKRNYSRYYQQKDIEYLTHEIRCVQRLWKECMGEG